MGEVWLARDTSLGRAVAIKVLPLSVADHADRLERFELEARAAGTLNHPNLVTIFELGKNDGAPYIVMELLEGETLRDRLDRGALPPRKAVDFAGQMANGLAAAHEKGVVHRDLKPENVFVTTDGRVKILDFGLAKLITPEEAHDDQTVRKQTAPGTVMGTAGYMSPEQVRGLHIDHRTDVFSFGAILYEMLSGLRAFRGDTAADMMSAILNDDPPEAGSSAQQTWPAVERVARRCLEKEPSQRFQSARDLSFALEAVTASGASSTVEVAERPLRRKRAGTTLLVAVAALLAGAAAYWLITSRHRTEPASFRQLTFARGVVYTARFAPDGKTIVYDGTFNGAPSALFTTLEDSAESRPLLDAPRLLAVSSKGELAVLVRPELLYHFQSRGTLARVALGGGRPREVTENVREADWSPDGSQLAIIRDAEGMCRLEYPLGHVLYATNGYISNMRMSPDGKHIAFFNHAVDADDRGSVEVVDLAGHRTKLWETGGAEEGLAWRPDSKEVWFTAAMQGTNTQLRAATPGGEQRAILGTPGGVILQDIAPDGRLLLCRDMSRSAVYARVAGETSDRDVSWLDQSFVGDISRDGKTLALTEESEAMGPQYAVCIRELPDGPPVRLGAGYCSGLSPDGRFVLSQDPDSGVVTVLPVAAGEAKRLPVPSGMSLGIGAAAWLPDGAAVVVFGLQQNRGTGYRIDFPTGVVHPIAAASVLKNPTNVIVSPDGRSAVVKENATGVMWIIPFDRAPARPVPGAKRFERAVQWADSRTIYVRFSRDVPAVINLLDVTTGQRRPWATLGQPDRGGPQTMYSLVMTPDGSAYAYDVAQSLTQLFLVNGLK